MDMAVDAARQHELAGRVDHRAGRPEILPERHHPSAANPDVAGEGVGGGRNRAAADTRAGALAAITATWKGPTLLGSTIYPEFSVSIPAGRFDEWSGATEGTDAITQELSGVVRYDGTNSPVTVTYKSADTTA